MNDKDIQTKAHTLIDRAQARKTQAERIHEGWLTDDPKLSLYLGSILNLSPSGKVYTPWANSNVTPCPNCKGKGCTYCGYTGSREAYEDQVWQNALEARANKYNAWIESGEGDPRDLYLCWAID